MPRKRPDFLPLPVTQRSQTKGGAAVALRIAGAPYEDIAQTLGYQNARDARLAVENTLAKSVPEENRDELRKIAGRRLERLLNTIWEKATTDGPEQLPAQKVALGLIDRHIRLYGLDAPQEMIVYTPAAAEIETWVQQMTEHVKGAYPDEADIVDVDVEEHTLDDVEDSA